MSHKSRTDAVSSSRRIVLTFFRLVVTSVVRCLPPTTSFILFGLLIAIAASSLQVFAAAVQTAVPTEADGFPGSLEFETRDDAETPVAGIARGLLGGFQVEIDIQADYAPLNYSLPVELVAVRPAGASGTEDFFTKSSVTATAVTNASNQLQSVNMLLEISNRNMSSNPNEYVIQADAGLNFAFDIVGDQDSVRFTGAMSRSAGGSNFLNVRRETATGGYASILTLFGSTQFDKTLLLDPGTYVVHSRMQEWPSVGEERQARIGLDIIFEEAVAPQRVGLAWGDDVPVAYSVVTDMAGNVSTVTGAGSTPAATVSQATRTDIRDRLEAILSASLVDNIEVVHGFVEDGTNIYFSDPLGMGSTLLGEAFTGIDQFNSRHDDGVVVFLTGNNELDAEVAGHELGHALGLRHVNPSMAADPSNLSLMDYDDAPGDVEEIINAVSEITEPPDDASGGIGVTHNPLYHVYRYVDGFSHQELVNIGIMPGNWDLSPGDGGSPSRVGVEIDFGGADLELFDVHIFSGFSSEREALTELAHFPSLSLSELEELSWTFLLGEPFQLLAASTDGGDLDVMLATGDPFDPLNLGVLSLPGDRPGLLQLMTNPQGAFTTLAQATLHGTAVPEPRALILTSLYLFVFLVRSPIPTSGRYE